MKITISEPDGLYETKIDPGVMDVEIAECFNGIMLVTEDGERLGICMRDSGFEMHYLGGDKSSTLSLRSGKILTESGSSGFAEWDDAQTGPYTPEQRRTLERVRRTERERARGEAVPVED